MLRLEIRDLGKIISLLGMNLMFTEKSKKSYTVYNNGLNEIKFNNLKTIDTHLM
jgi:hypothetical protein